VVNFDDLVGQAEVPAGYGGVDWMNNWQHFDFDQPPYTPHSGLTRVTPLQGGALEFGFPGPVHFEGAWFAGRANNLQLHMFLGDSAVHSTTPVGLSSTPLFVASDYTGPVDEVHISAFDGFVMDDVTFDNANAIPEPGTVMLLLGGLVGVTVIRRARVR
jgi:hypothetical protein